MQVPKRFSFSSDQRIGPTQGAAAASAASAVRRAKTGLLPARGTEMLHINITVDSLTMADEYGALVLIPGKYSIILSTGTQGAEEIIIPLALQGERVVLEKLPPGI